MPVFSAVRRDHEPFLARALLSAAHELDLFSALTRSADAATLAARLGVQARRLRPALDALVLIGALRRDGEGYGLGQVPPPPEPVPPEGWGRLADVLRSQRPLPEDSETRRRMHEHLAEVGRPEAAELAERFLSEARSLLDLGGGVGTYSAAFLSAVANSSATLVDRAETLALIEDPPARLTQVAGELPGAVDALPPHDAALLSNVLHLHGPETSAELVAAAARAVGSGGWVLVKDLYISPDRSGPPESVWFALNMALYTEAGDVHDPERIATWLREAGLIDVEAQRLQVAPESVVVRGRRP